MYPVGGHENAEGQEENKPRSLNDAPSHFTSERLKELDLTCFTTASTFEMTGSASMVCYPKEYSLPCVTDRGTTVCWRT